MGRARMRRERSPTLKCKLTSRSIKGTFDPDEFVVRLIRCFGPDTDGTDVVVDATNGMQCLIVVKEIVKQIRQGHLRKGIVEEIEGLSMNSVRNRLSRRFHEEQLSESIVEQMADVAVQQAVQAVTQTQQIPTKKGQETPWKKSWK